MKNVYRWGLAAGLAAALALMGSAQAQSSAGGSSDSTAGSRGDTGGPPPGGGSATGQTGSSTDHMGGAPGTSSDTGSSATGERATGTPGTAGQKISKSLQDKLEKIHAANQAEISLAQLGTQNAQSPDVKQFAELMQSDHQKADQKLTDTAQSLGVSLEGKTYQKEHDRVMKESNKLQSKTGAAFDKDYMSAMVKEHKKDAKEVQSAANDARKAKQTELASVLDETHTGMQSHLQHAQQIEKSLGKTRQGRRPAGTSGTGSSGAAPGPSGSSGAAPGGPSEPGSR